MPFLLAARSSRIRRKNARGTGNSGFVAQSFASGARKERLGGDRKSSNAALLDQLAAGHSRTLANEAAGVYVPLDRLTRLRLRETIAKMGWSIYAYDFR